MLMNADSIIWNAIENLPFSLKSVREIVLPLPKPKILTKRSQLALLIHKNQHIDLSQEDLKYLLDVFPMQKTKS